MLGAGVLEHLDTIGDITVAAIIVAIFTAVFAWFRKARRRDLFDAIRSTVPTIPVIAELATKHATLVAGQTDISTKLDTLRVENSSSYAVVGTRLDGLTGQVVELARTQSTHSERLARLEARHQQESGS